MSAAFPEVQRYQSQQAPMQQLPMPASFPEMQQVPMSASFPEMRPQYQPQQYPPYPQYY